MHDTEYNSAALIQFCRQGLDEGLKDNLSKVNLAENMPELLKLIRRVDDRLRKRKREKERFSFRSKPTAETAKTFAPQSLKTNPTSNATLRITSNPSTEATSRRPNKVSDSGK
jgi:hypothetical protein